MKIFSAFVIVVTLSLALLLFPNAIGLTRNYFTNHRGTPGHVLLGWSFIMYYVVSAWVVYRVRDKKAASSLTLLVLMASVIPIVVIVLMFLSSGGC